jgi:hypothetical protein
MMNIQATSKPLLIIFHITYKIYLHIVIDSLVPWRVWIVSHWFASKIVFGEGANGWGGT